MRYIIYGKYSNNGDEFLMTAAKNKTESNEILESHKKYGINSREIPITTYFKDTNKDIDSKICKVLNDLRIDDETYERTIKHFHIEIEGDWKHDHKQADYILNKIFNCNLISEDVIEEDGSDWYSSIHTYCL